MNKKGIDVSKHQGIINWNKVKKAGIEFAIIRAGYGKSTVDKYFIENIVGANTAGIEIGIYWFIYAKNKEEALKNAEMCHKTIEKYKNIITMKVWADWEYDSDNNSIKNGVTQTKNSRTEIVMTFLEYLKDKGYEVGNYANPDYLKNKFNDLSKYPLWLARYSDSMGEYNPLMWQYTSKGNIDGIKGNVDMNIYYGKEEVKYYSIPDFTLVDSLNKIGVDSSYENRARIAKANGINDYKGTKEQNIRLLDLIKSGKLIKA